MSAPYIEEQIEGPAQTPFYCRLYSATNARAILVFLHGFIEHIGRYEHVFPLWQVRGVSVFAFDLRGFGKTAEDVGGSSKNVKSKSSYGKTSGKDQLQDVEWAIKTAKEKLGKTLPVFLMGHSMGGGIALSFPTRTIPPPSPEAVTLLSGVIATSPLVRQTHPVPKITRWAGGLASHVLPSMVVSAPVKPKHLSHDASVGERYLKDPYVKFQGSLQCINDMFERGDDLLDSQYRNWPENLPVLIIHGTADEVTSSAASQQFYDKLNVKDKTFTQYPDGFHELHNEPDGVKERMIEECIAWVEAHLPSPPVPSAAKL